LENEIKIMKAISKDVNMNFGLEVCKNLFKTREGPEESICRKPTGEGS
jgi:hypothetical protein